MNLHEIYARDRLRQGQVGQARVEETPALYFLAEILALGDRTPDDLREIHKAKLAYPDVRIVQERVET